MPLQKTESNICVECINDSDCTNAYCNQNMFSFLNQVLTHNAENVILMTKPNGPTVKDKQMFAAATLINVVQVARNPLNAAEL